VELGRFARPTVVPSRRTAARPRAFSLIEMLIALAITATLLTASLAALDSSFKSYKLITDSASTQVVSRIVMSRVMTMIRTGTEFGPYPEDPLDPNQNPIVSNFIEFVSGENEDAGWRQVTRIETRAGQGGGTELWVVITEFQDGVQISENERVLLRNLSGAVFTLEYDVGPRLKRATVDLTIIPDDTEDQSALASDIEAPAVRLVSSAAPRTLD